MTSWPVYWLSCDELTRLLIVQGYCFRHFLAILNENTHSLKAYNWNRYTWKKVFFIDISFIFTRRNNMNELQILTEMVYIFSSFGNTRDTSHNFFTLSSGNFSRRLQCNSIFGCVVKPGDIEQGFQKKKYWFLLF